MVSAFIFRADLYCGGCAGVRMVEMTREGVRDGVDCWKSEDSDDFPQGPYPDGGGESDSPAYCGGCGMFLKNPLTSDGYVSLQEQIKTAQSTNKWPYPLTEQVEFYALDLALNMIKGQE